MGRWPKHKHLLKNNKCKNLHLQHAWNKDGEQNFKFEIILECPVENLNQEEIRLIKEYKSTNREFGYNLEEGGRIQQIISEETREKISKANKGLRRSEACKKGISERSKNRICTEETRRKLSETSKGRKHSEETKKKISQARKGIIFTEEHKRRIGEKSKGRQANLGNKHTEEAKKKMSNAHRGMKYHLRK